MAFRIPHPLAAGRFFRSLGSWSEVLALRGRGEKQKSDQRILGDSEFVQDVISGLDDLVKKNLRLSGQRINTADLAQQVCKKYNPYVLRHLNFARSSAYP